MPIGQDNEQFAKGVQAWLRSLGFDLVVDGWAGKRTRGAMRAAQAMVRGKGLALTTPRWPEDNTVALTDFYGEPGLHENLAAFPLPYPMTLSWTGETVHHLNCHYLVAGSLKKVLQNLLAYFGNDGIREHGLDVTGGIFNVRPIASGSRLSTHAWAASIDLNPDQNQSHMKWPEEASMPVEAIDIFEAEGWTSLARKIGRDAMHFEATSSR